MISRKFLLFVMTLITYSSFAQTWIHIKDLPSVNDFEFYGSSVSLSLYGDRMAVGAIGTHIALPVESTNGHVRVYERNGSDWIQLGPTLYGTGPVDQFGSSVSLNAYGSRMAVSAPFYGALDKGQVRVFEWNGVAWVQLGQDILGDNPNSYWGRTCLNDKGNILAIGVSANGVGEPGLVRIYQFDGLTWQQMGSDLTDKNSLNDFGASISLSGSGNRIAIGASQNGEAPGYVAVYDWNGADWLQVGSSIQGIENGSAFGRSVDLSRNGSTLAVGAYFYDGPNQNIGQTTVFHFDEGDWSQIGLAIDGVNNDDRSGDVVELSPDGSLLAISSLYNDDNGNDAGHVRVFEWINDTWSQFEEVYTGDALDGYAGSISFSYLETPDKYMLAMSSMYHDVPYFQGGGVRTFAYITGPFSPAGGNESRISVFPNPAKNMLNIDVYGEIVDDITIRSESTGEKLIEASGKSVDISALPAGKFILIAKLRSGKIHSEHFVVD